MAEELALWGRILIHNDLVEADDWSTVSGWLRKRMDAKPLGELLVEAGFLDVEQRDYIQGIIEKMLAKEKAGQQRAGEVSPALTPPSNKPATEPDESEAGTNPDAVELAPERSADDAGPHASQMMQHPQSYQDRDYQPGDDEVVDLADGTVEFNGERATVKQHARSYQDRDYTPSEDDVLDVAPERSEGERLSIRYGGYLPDGYRKSEQGNDDLDDTPEDGDLEVDLGDDDGTLGNRLSDMDWVENTEHEAESKFELSDEERIDLEGDEDEDDDEDKPS